MKKTMSLLAALLMLLCLIPASAQTGMLPLYECYPATGDGNAWIEIPNRYELFTMPMSYTCGYVVDPAAKVPELSMCVFAHIPEGFRQRIGEMDVSGFAEDGRAVLGGADKTDASTVIERYTISDLPAARVDMTGQGFEMIWIADGGDMYFFMYPILNETFAQDMRDAADTFHLVSAETAAASDPADYEYTVSDEGVTITGYTGESVRVAIPSEIDGQPVTVLGDKAFYETGVRWVDVPEGVKMIGAYCFSGCNDLMTLRLPGSLTTIADGALESCFRLLTLDVPEGVTDIGQSVFFGNSYLYQLRLPASLEAFGSNNFVAVDSLESVDVAEGCKAFKAQDGGRVLLSADGKRFVRYFGWQECTSYTIPDGVETIGSFAFSDYGTLREIIVPEGVKTIEGAAFVSAFGLQKLHLPASVTDLGRFPGEEGTGSIAGKVTIIAPEGSAAQAYAEQFQLSFEAAPAADEIQ